MEKGWDIKEMFFAAIGIVFVAGLLFLVGLRTRQSLSLPPLNEFSKTHQAQIHFKDLKAIQQGPYVFADLLREPQTERDLPSIVLPENPILIAEREEVQSHSKHEKALKSSRSKSTKGISKRHKRHSHTQLPKISKRSKPKKSQKTSKRPKTQQRQRMAQRESPKEKGIPRALLEAEF